MCGITIYIIHQENKDKKDYKSEILKASKSIRHRGPDWSGIQIISGLNKEILMTHERLAIIDPESGSQPILIENDFNSVLYVAIVSRVCAVCRRACPRRESNPLPAVTLVDHHEGGWGHKDPVLLAAEDK